MRQVRPLFGGLANLREIARLRHGGVGEAPDQRGDGEIGGDRGDAVGERDHRHLLPGLDLRQAAVEMGVRPDQPEHEQGEAADENAGDGRRRRRAACARCASLALRANSRSANCRKASRKAA